MTGVFERATVDFARAITRAMLSDRTARRRGLLQSLDPRVRVVGLFVLVLAVTVAHKIGVIAVLFGSAVVLALLSGVDLRTLATRVWLLVLAFTGVIALPALFLTPGNAIAAIGRFSITGPGLRAAGLLVLRVETAATFTTVLVLCTPWPHLLKALRVLRVPREVITILAMTYRYVLLLVQTAAEMVDSRRSRTVGVLSPREQRRMVSQTAGVLLSKSMDTSAEVYRAMQSRAFRGEVHVLSEFHLTMWDYGALLAFLLAGVTVWMGR